VKVLGYYFDASVSECLQRNEAREGKARVPDVAIYSTAKKLVAPSIEEGFDELLCVRVNDSAFEVRGCWGRTRGVSAAGPGDNETSKERWRRERRMDK
jgi:hypothetical protein